MKKKEHTVERPILVVDDNPVIVKLLEAMLDRSGYPVVTAHSGQDALALLDTLLPDLILLDIDMPGLSGLDTCRVLKENPRTAEIPIIFVTASNDKNDIVAGFAAGAQDYIIKPSTQEELLARVRTHLALCKTQQALKASRARYRELSFLDDLTGLYNTRYLYQNLEKHLARHPEQPLTVIFMDIDRFKHVVDTYGHLNGSRAIAELAAIIKQRLPRGGYGVSYGGDEFVVVLGGHDGQAGRQLAEEVRAAIADHRFLTAHGLTVHLTVSCGLASYPEDAATLVDLLGNADQALFATKREGKNAVTTFAEMQAAPQQDGFLPLNQR
jgi:diguanylate cyclase (GGDEF)-like protein